MTVCASPLRGRAAASQPSLGEGATQLVRAPRFRQPVVRIRRPPVQSKGTERGDSYAKRCDFQTRFQSRLLHVQFNFTDKDRSVH